MTEYKNGLGLAYRSLESTAEELETKWEKGEVRISQEEIDVTREAIVAMTAFHERINSALDKFQTIAPPPVRNEPKE